MLSLIQNTALSRRPSGPRGTPREGYSRGGAEGIPGAAAGADPRSMCVLHGPLGLLEVPSRLSRRLSGRVPRSQGGGETELIYAPAPSRFKGQQGVTECRGNGVSEKERQSRVCRHRDACRIYLDVEGKIVNRRNGVTGYRGNRVAE